MTRRFLAIATMLLMAGLTALPAPLLAQAVPDPDAPLRIEISDGVAEPMPIALPPFFADDAPAQEMAEQIARVIAEDLTGSGLFRTMDRADFLQRLESFESPVSFPDWKAIEAEALVTGAVSLSGDQLRVQFRLFDIFAGKPLGDGMQFDAAAEGWRRVAHKLADQIYHRITGEAPYFDSRIVFVGETGPAKARRKRIGIADYDGAGVSWLTDSAALVFSPRFSADGETVMFTSFAPGRPQILATPVAQIAPRPLTGAQGEGMSFGPRPDPTGRWIAFSRESGGNTDIWQMDRNGDTARRLTQGPAIDSAPAWAPDGRRIVFESDRSGENQLYVMGADGSDPTRISFEQGQHFAPAWSPRGDLIAFTRIGAEGMPGGIGVMRPDGSGARLITDDPRDSGASFAPNGRVVMFTRHSKEGPRLYSVDISGQNMRAVGLEMAASDPAWGPLLP